MSQRILIIDDDTELCEMVSDYLSLEGFATHSVHSGTEGVEQALSGGFDAAILDVMLPGLNGFDVLRQVRANTQIPVLMLTARGEEVDRIVGLEMGADDYLPKPFNPRELTARLKAILRRFKVNQAVGSDHKYQMAGLELQPSARRANLNGNALDLTSSEFNILEVLIQHPDQVVSKETISEMALGKPLERYDRSIDMHISHLRRKLDSGAPENPQILTIRGIGYQLCPTNQEGSN
ncbi:response regulator transcription factor [Porticoccaceae bacterium LTM1]|nr:response regulator transcription factor [Porticoccaceae bacterium LTM1]